MKNYDVMEFCPVLFPNLDSTQTDPIVVRAHPGDKRIVFKIELSQCNCKH